MTSVWACSETIAISRNRLAPSPRTPATSRRRSVPLTDALEIFRFLDMGLRKQLPGTHYPTWPHTTAQDFAHGALRSPVVTCLRVLSKIQAPWKDGGKGAARTRSGRGSEPPPRPPAAAAPAGARARVVERPGPRAAPDRGRQARRA